MRTSGQECVQDEEQVQATRGAQEGAVPGGDYRGTQKGHRAKVHNQHMSVDDTQGEAVHLQGDLWKFLQKT
jgi:hypothetical protein